jgi:hypothetical protein
MTPKHEVRSGRTRQKHTRASIAVLLNLIESNEAAFAFYVHLLLLLLRSDVTLFSVTDRISELVLDLPPKSLYRLLRLAETVNSSRGCSSKRMKSSSSRASRSSWNFSVNTRAI